MGKVYLVGGGPGDPELLTVKAYKLIQSADVILFDALVNKEILSLAKPDCLKIYVGKRDGKHSLPQEEINDLMIRLSRVYDRVVRLKGGDPFVFGRGGEEILALVEEGVDVEVVPGVSSAIAGPASAGIPVTYRGIASSFAVVTGHPNRDIDWSAFAKVDTLIILMGVKNRQKIAQELIKVGRDPAEPVAFVESATTSKQREIFTTLKDLAEKPPHVNPPAVMVVGKVVKVGSIIALKSLKGWSDGGEEVEDSHNPARGTRNLHKGL